MEIQDAINELSALEDYFRQGLKRATQLRKNLSSVQGSAPSGEVDQSTKAQIINMMEKRTSKILQKQK